MFRLARFLFSLVLFCVVVWFAVTVPLGKRTLWGHLRAIFKSQEVKDLEEGTKREAKRVAESLRHSVRPDAGHPPLDPIDGPERKRLDKLVRDKTAPKRQ